ncbi:MAG: aldo/keto reductase [Alphaproteobacteria bacterium]|nr:aldo/keto reductase [Alphaproteobacteria bacterium]
MDKRKLGKTGLDVSLLGFGCGAVGGLMVGGEPADQQRAVARALELGVNYFDTAAQYGNGRSEENLGRVIKALQLKDIHVGTKVRLPPTDPGQIAVGIAAALDASLRRLQLERVDLYQFHNAIVGATAGGNFAVESMLDEVVPAFETLVQQGKIGHYGITAVGDTASLLRVVDARAFATAQVSFNLLNPSPGAAVPAGFPAQDYGGLLAHTKAANMGVINIRVLAGGALSGSEERHRLASPPPDPIGSGSSYRIDLERARRFMPLVHDGHADSLVELALRYVIAHDAISTVLIGIATLEQFEIAARAIEKGPLSAAGLARIAEIQASFVGEQR